MNQKYRKSVSLNKSQARLKRDVFVRKFLDIIRLLLVARFCGERIETYVENISLCLSGITNVEVKRCGLNQAFSDF